MANIKRLLELSNARLKNTVRYSRQVGCLYLNVPKSGCTAIKKGLWEAAGGTEYRHKKQIDPSYEQSFVYSASELGRLSDHPFVFTIVRNPFARVYSAFWDKVICAPSSGGKVLRELELDFFPNYNSDFKSFLSYILKIPDENRNPHFRSCFYQSNLAFVRPDFIGSIELINESLSFIESKFNIRPGWRSPPNSRNSSATLFEAFDSEAVEMVKKAYPMDFDSFGYSTKLEEAFMPPIKTQLQVSSEKS